MAFWLGEDVRRALTNLQAELAKHTVVPVPGAVAQQGEFHKLLEAIAVLLRPGFVEGEPDKSKPLLCLFTQFRVFENYIFFKSKALTDKAREAIIVVFEMLVDFICQYYWEIRKLFDPVLKDPVLKDPMPKDPMLKDRVLKGEPSQTLLGFSEKYEANRKIISDATKTPFSYHKDFIKNSRVVEFCQQYSGGSQVECNKFASKIGVLTKKTYEQDSRAAIYLDLLSVMQDVTFDKVEDRFLKMLHKPIEYFFVTFYFQLLGCLLFSNIPQSFLYDNVDPKEYDCEAREKLQVFSLRSPNATIKTSSVKVMLSTSEICQQCNKPQTIGGASIEKCSTCGESYHISCMKKVIVYIGSTRSEKLKCSTCQALYVEVQHMVAKLDVSMVCAAINCKVRIAADSIGATCADPKCPRKLCQACACQLELHPTCHYRDSTDRTECRGNFKVLRQQAPTTVAASVKPEMSTMPAFTKIWTELAAQRVIRMLPPRGALSGQVLCSLCEQITAESVYRYLQEQEYNAWAHRSCLLRQQPQFFAQAGDVESYV